MAISRMQEPRQLYGLGSLVKKAVRGVKKIVKSPLGKAAIFGGLAGDAVARSGGLFGSLKNMIGGMTTGQKIFTGLGAAAVATPFLQKAFKTGPYEEIEEEVDESYIPPFMAMAMARNRDPYMAFLPNEQFAQSGFYMPQNVAEGGRIGYANGEMVEAEQMVETEGPQLPPEPERFLREAYKNT